MRFRLVLFILLGIGNVVLGCECDDRKLALEAYESDVIFIGEAISKTYSHDSSKYTIEFKVDQFYKNIRENRTTLKFTKVSEWEYSGVMNSCSWHLGFGFKWLVLAKYVGREISFGVCSNSRRLFGIGLYTNEKRILDNLNRFDISNYRFHHDNDFSNVKPLTNVDSLINIYSNGKYDDQVELIIFDFDQEGNLTAANFYPGKNKPQIIEDPLFNMSIMANIEYKKPLNDFEEASLNIARKIVKWTPKFHRRTGDLVLGRTHAYFIVDDNGEIAVQF